MTGRAGREPTVAAEVDPACPTIDVGRRAGAWGPTSGLTRRARELLAATWARLPTGHRPAPGGEIALVLGDDALLAALNRRYRGRPGPTNVLAFPGTAPLLGDVVIARQTLEREAAEQGKTAEHHLAHLIVHGLLHLFGYDHDNPAEQRHMESLEVAILRDLGIDNPYVMTDEPDRQGGQRWSA
jgi:probable rRNA maturation factor